MGGLFSCAESHILDRTCHVVHCQRQDSVEEQLTVQPSPGAIQINTPQGALQTSPPNFTGTWLLQKTEGDPDGVLKAAGISWGLRTSMSLVSYGKDSAKQSINHQGATFQLRVVDMVAGSGIKTQYSVVVSGERQRILGLDGKKQTTRVVWEADGRTLAFVDVQEEDGKAGPTQRRYILPQGGENGQTSLVMVHEVSLQGKTMRRYYTQQDTQRCSMSPIVKAKE